MEGILQYYKKKNTTKLLKCKLFIGDYGEYNNEFLIFKHDGKGLEARIRLKDIQKLSKYTEDHSWEIVLVSGKPYRLKFDNPRDNTEWYELFNTILTNNTGTIDHPEKLIQRNVIIEPDGIESNVPYFEVKIVDSFTFQYFLTQLNTSNIYQLSIHETKIVLKNKNNSSEVHSFGADTIEKFIYQNNLFMIAFGQRGLHGRGTLAITSMRKNSSLLNRCLYSHAVKFYNTVKEKLESAPVEIENDDQLMNENFNNRPIISQPNNNIQNISNPNNGNQINDRSFRLRDHQMNDQDTSYLNNDAFNANSIIGNTNNGLNSSRNANNIIGNTNNGLNSSRNRNMAEYAYQANAATYYGQTNINEANMNRQYTENNFMVNRPPPVANNNNRLNSSQTHQGVQSLIDQDNSRVYRADLIQNRGPLTQDASSSGDETDISFYKDQYKPQYYSNRNLHSNATEYFNDHGNSSYGKVTL